MKYSTYILILLSILVASCGKENKDNNSVDNVETISFQKHYQEKIPFSFFVDTIELIPLETTDDNLIGEVNRIICKNNRYYIRSTNGHQNGKIFVFDQQGNYLWKLDRRGEGPEEYINLEDFAIQNEKIYAASFHNIQVYDSVGNHLKKIDIDNLASKEIWAVSPNKLLALNFAAIRHGNNLLTLINENGIEKQFFDVGKCRATRSSQSINSNSICFHSSVYYVNNIYENEIFAITANHWDEIKPVYRIDYGNKNIDKIKITEDDDYMSWSRKKDAASNYMLIISFGVTDSAVFIGSIDDNRKSYLTFYSPKTKNSFSTHKFVDDMFLKGAIIPITGRRIPHNIDGNDILWEIDPEILMDGFKQYWSNLSTPRREAFKRDYAEWYRICTTLKEDDNPVLMRIKVKNF